MISEERIVEWLFTALETCVSCSSFDMVGTQQERKEEAVIQGDEPGRSSPVKGVRAP